MKLIVGVDADGVLTNMSEFYQKYGRKFFKKDPVNIEAYGLKEMFNVTKFDEIKFGFFHLDKYCRYEPPRPQAVEVLQKLRDDNHEFHEITARKFASFRNLLGLHYRNLFKKWLKKNFNNIFSSIQYCSESNSPTDKLIACSKLGVDVMIEDKPEVAIHLANNNIRILLMDAPYNQEVEHENIIRVYNWDEIYDEIKKLESKLDFMNNENFKKMEKTEIANMTNNEKEMYFYNYKRHLKNININEELLKKGENRFKLLYHPMMIPIKLLLRPKVINKKNIPYQDGFIIASNHLNSYDQYLIGAALGNRSVTGFAASTIKNTFRGKLFDFTKGAIFMDRQDENSKAICSEELAARVAHDKIALIFPEGTRKNKDEEGRKKILLDFKLGTVAIAQKTGAPILPMALSYGKYNLVRIGIPFIVTPTEDLEEVNKKLYNKILELQLENAKFKRNKDGRRL